MLQVINITAEGVISGLQVKPGHGFDLRKLGQADIERASEIVHDFDMQMWSVHILDEAVCRHFDSRYVGSFGGPVRGHTLSMTDYQTATGRGAPSQPHVCTAGREPLMLDWLFFAEYEEAVAVEVEVLNALRRQGIYDRG